MRVGVLTTSYPRGAGDFAGWFVAERARALLAEGHEVDVLAAGAGAPLGTTREGRLALTRLPSSFGDADLFAGAGAPEALEAGGLAARDRKSTRLNSSHTVISYAVFCLKKKKKKIKTHLNYNKNTIKACTES